MFLAGAAGQVHGRTGAGAGKPQRHHGNIERLLYIPPLHSSSLRSGGSLYLRSALNKAQPTMSRFLPQQVHPCLHRVLAVMRNIVCTVSSPSFA